MESTTFDIAATGVQSPAPWPIYLAIAAVLFIIVCVVIPKLIKKK